MIFYLYSFKLYYNLETHHDVWWLKILVVVIVSLGFGFLHDAYVCIILGVIHHLLLQSNEFWLATPLCSAPFPLLMTV